MPAANALQGSTHVCVNCISTCPQAVLHPPPLFTSRPCSTTISLRANAPHDCAHNYCAIHGYPQAHRPYVTLHPPPPTHTAAVYLEALLQRCQQCLGSCCNISQWALSQPRTQLCCLGILTLQVCGCGWGGGGGGDSTARQGKAGDTTVVL